MKKKQPFLSIILPVFNEQRRLKNVEEIISYLHRKNLPYEILIVNDGSNHATVQILKKFDKMRDVKVLHSYPNKGKGFAVRQGMLHARGKYRLFMDIDLSTPLESIDLFLKALRSSPIVIATRKSEVSKITTHQPLVRETMGKSFTVLSRIITGVFVSDFTCGFKAFSDTAARKLFTISQIDRWSFDAEILYLAKKHNLKVQEVPITWKNNDETKVVFPRDIFISLKELLSIRIYDFLGRYNASSSRA